MKIYRLPSRIRALAFDMDLTLYTNPEYGQYQIDSIVERLGKLRGLSFDMMNSEVKEARKNWALLHGGKQPSLSDLLASYGICMDENIKWREEAYEPEKYINKDPRLMHTLKRLSSSFIIGVITNNPVLTARRTLTALGVSEYFSILVGLDTCKVSKPHREPFLKFSEFSLCPAETCVSIGDRYDIDLDTPLDMGMGGILVDGVEDVYELPDILMPEDFD